MVEQRLVMVILLTGSLLDLGAETVQAVLKKASSTLP
jgi:hypothetical protein